MMIPSITTLNDKSIPYHSGNTWAIIYPLGPLASTTYALIMVGETHNQCFHEEPLNSGSTLARVPVFQFITLTFVKHHSHFQSFRDNHLKYFICTLCATFTLSAKSYQHEWTHGQHFMQLLLPFPNIEKIVFKNIFSFHTPHSI